VVEDGDTAIDDPVPIGAEWEEFVYHTQEPSVPIEPPDTVSILEVPGQTGLAPDTAIPVGAEGGEPDAGQHVPPSSTVKSAWLEET
jgi:hypothetical protein